MCVCVCVSFSLFIVSLGIKPRQFRQFYVRFKSSISPVKKQLSKFGGTIVSGSEEMCV